MACVERLKLLGSCLFSLLSFALFVYGSVSEVLGDNDLRNQLQKLSVSHIDEEIKFLKVYIIYYIVLACLTVLIIAIFSFQDCRLTYERLQGNDFAKHQRRLNTTLRLYLLSVATVGAFKTILYGSLLNKFRAQGLWNGSFDYDINALYVVVPYFGTRNQDSWTIEEHIKVDITITVFNIYRTIVLFIPMTVIEYEQIWKKFGIQILFIIPSIFIAAAVGFKAVTAIMVEHYTQRFYTEQQDFAVTSTIINSVVGALFGIVVMSCFLVRVTQIINNLINPSKYKVSSEALQEMTKGGTLGMYNEMYGVSKKGTKLKDTEKSEEEKKMEKEIDQAREMMIDFVVRLIFSSSTFMYGLIEFALVLDVHARTGFWNWYFTVDVVYSGVLWTCGLLDCCCSCVQVSKQLNKGGDE